MLKQIIGKLWRTTPQKVRVKLVRAIETKFTASVGAIITNEKNQVLLLDHVLRPGSGWGIPGGFLEKDEQPAEAIKRELHEETGIEIENIEIIHVKTIYRHIEVIFRATGKGTAKVKSREIKDLGWFDSDDMPAGMNKQQKEFIRQVLSKTLKY